MENKFYKINTYGCQMNIHDSEKLAGMLEKLGYKETFDDNVADVIVFNTCCIRESAEQKIYGNIGALKGIKKNKKDLIIAVCGCMSQQDGVADNIKAKFPFVNIVFGTHNLHMFEEYLQKHLKTKKKVYDVWQSEGQVVEDIPAYRTSKYNGWVNIMYGCNNFCTYCIVPYVRGRERSRKLEEILKEVRLLVEQGYKTITLLGQNVNSYGNDFDDDTNFAKLLSEICKIEGNFRLRFMTSHPKDLTDEVISVIAREDKISKTIHLPVQSGSNAILKAMNRKYTVEHYKGLIDKIKAAIPNVSLTTDLIVGFPGETEEDFDGTLDLVRYCKYTSLFGFMYSKRKGTVAEKMEGHLPIAVKRERVNKLLALSKEIGKQVTESMIGGVYEVLMHEEKCKLIGKTECGKTVEISNLTSDIKAGEFYNVKLESFNSNKLFGKII